MPCSPLSLIPVYPPRWACTRYTRQCPVPCQPRLKPSSYELLSQTPVSVPVLKHCWGTPSCSPGRGAEARAPPSTLHGPQVLRGCPLERGRRAVARRAQEGPRLTALSLPQMPLQPALLLQLTPPSPRHSHALRHPLNTRLVPRSAASAMGTPASSGESPGSWGGFT